MGKKKGFERKKVGSLTLGERLTSLRKEHRVSIHEFSKHTHIQKKYVEALEGGQYFALPSYVYVRGYIKSYESYFGLSDGVLTKLLESEYQIYENMSHEDDREILGRKSSFLSRIVFTPRIVVVSLLALALGGISIYAYLGARQFVAAPFIDITTPENGSRIEDPTVSIEGRTHPEAFLYINDEPVAVDIDGTFVETVSLSAGENIFNLRSEGSAGQSTEQKFVLVSTFDPPEAVAIVPEDPPRAEGSGVTVQATATDEAVWIRVLSDDVSISDQTLEPGETVTFEARNEIVVTASRGNGLLIIHNDVEKGLLSEDDGIVRDVLFGLPEVGEALSETDGSDPLEEGDDLDQGDA